jgi:gliding motility-associated-like protein
MFSFRTPPVLYLLLFLLPASSFANHRYVNINNPTPGAGTSWATAYTDLNAAAAGLSIFDTIWVAQGIYKPTGVGRAATFLFTSGSVCGGFNGTETAFSQRDPKTNLTILSGDIGITGDASDNCYHVVTLWHFNGSSVVDGFTIRDGNANAGYPGSTTLQPDNSGGGVLNLASNPSDLSYAGIGHCIITNNFAVYGGGFCAYGNANSAQSWGLITTTLFNNNTAAVMGGAIAIITMNLDWGGTDIRNCIFTSNNCTGSQGSVLACLADNPYTGATHSSLDNCTLYDNGAPVIYNQQNGSTVSNIELTNDIVWKSGTAYPGPVVTGNNVPFFNNSDVDLVTPLVGGGNLDADPLFVNAAGNDFHLTPCSPCIDKGYDLFNVTTDFEGTVRPQGAAKDMGAYEAAGTGGVSAAPTAPAASFCLNATATALTATGSNLLWYTTATGGSGSSTAPVPSTAATGTTTFYVTQTLAGSCESIRTPVTVTIKNLSAAPTAPSPTYCQNATATALTATGSNLLWYTAAANGTGSSIAPVPSTASVGTATWYVSQTTGGLCESARTPVTVTVGSPSAAPTATSPTYCQNTAATALTATGSNLLWYTVAVNGTGTATAPVPSTAATGTRTWYVTQTPAGSCESTRTPVTVTVNSQAAAPTGASPVFCQNTIATALTATGSNLLWYTAATNGTGSATAPVPSTASVGYTTWYVTQTPAGSCESARTPLQVTVIGQPAAPTAAPVNYCEFGTAVPLTATGSNLLWYTTATNGSGTATAPTPATNAVGTTTYYVSQSAAACESPRTAITVTVGSQPAAPTAPSPTYCQNDAAVALTATGTNLLWYTTAAGGTGSAVAPIPSTATAGTSTYYVSQTNGCESARTMVTATVNANPVADFSWSPACAGAASTISAIGTTPASGSYTWNFGSTTSVKGAGAGPYQVTWSTGGDHAVTLTATTGACQSQKTYNVTVYPLPQVSISPLTGALCAGGTVTLNATGATTYQWSPATGLSDAAISNPVAALSTDMLYTVTGTDNNGCVDSAKISLKPSIACLGYNIPDAFTPNSDGHNDIFRVVSADVPQSFHMMIFNRYGGKVFETKDIQSGWNGYMGSSPAMTGAYAYVVVIKTSIGTTIEKKGTVLVIR